MPAAEPLPKPESAAIQGRWEIVSVSGGWKPKSITGLHVVITPDLIKFYYGNIRAFGMSYKIDPSRNPRALDMIRNEKGKPVVQLGTYQLAGDTLKVCVEAAGKPRPPKAFLGDGASATSWVFKRSRVAVAAR